MLFSRKQNTMLEQPYPVPKIRLDMKCIFIEYSIAFCIFCGIITG